MVGRLVILLASQLFDLAAFDDVVLPALDRHMQLRADRCRAAVDRYQGLFTSDYYTYFVATEQDRDVFATTYFNKPKPVPKPKPPGTRSVALTFMGSMENSRGEVTAFLSVDNQLKKLVIGENIVADWHLAGVANQVMTLTNAAPETNVIGFEKTLKLDIPIR